MSISKDFLKRFLPQKLKISNYLYRTLIILVIISLGANKLYKLAPLTEGWWRVYSRWISEGLIPYKDFNLIVPPGMPYIDLFFSKIFGQEFIILRPIGLVIQCLIALLIYEILVKLISKAYAFLLATIGIIILYSTEVVILFDYNYFAIFFLILSVWLWQLSEESKWSEKKSLLYSVLSGFVLGCSLLVKINFGFFLAAFYLGITFFNLFTTSHQSRKTTLIKLSSKIIGISFSLIPVALYFQSKKALGHMFNSLFLESSGAKGSASDALFNWILHLYDQLSFRKEVAITIFAILMYIGLEKVLLPISYDLNTKYFKIRNLKLPLYKVRAIYICLALIYIYFAVSNLGRLQITGIESDWIIFFRQISSLVLPHTFIIPVTFIFIFSFWAIRKEKQKWVPLVTLCLTLIWGSGTSGALNWYATAIPTVTLFAWISTRTKYLEFIGIVTLFVSIAISTTLYANWMHSPYNWWGYRTPPVYLATTTSDSGLTKGLQMDLRTQIVLKSVEKRLKEVQNCSGGLLVFPHMPIFQLDLNSQPNRRDAIYWFDFVSQANIKKAIVEIEENPPAGFVIVKVPKFVWDGHSKAFLGGEKYAQEELIAALERESKKGYTSMKYRLYQGNEDWSVTVHTRNSCERRK